MVFESYGDWGEFRGDLMEFSLEFLEEINESKGDDGGLAKGRE